MKHTEAKTKWLPHCRQHLKIHFLYENCYFYYSDSTDFPKHSCNNRVVTGLEKCLNFSKVLKKCLIFYFALKIGIFSRKVFENNNFIIEKYNI